ncbi:hypothetical protein C8R46DRAFT_180046 [Mycena filopes]|nr:hypothetical protein C8R46DRAFT_180046 [Mycena filopes]
MATVLPPLKAVQDAVTLYIHRDDYEPHPPPLSPSHWDALSAMDETTVKLRETWGDAVLNMELTELVGKRLPNAWPQVRLDIVTVLEKNEVLRQLQIRANVCDPGPYEKAPGNSYETALGLLVKSPDFSQPILDKWLAETFGPLITAAMSAYPRAALGI